MVLNTECGSCISLLFRYLVFSTLYSLPAHLIRQPGESTFLFAPHFALGQAHSWYPFFFLPGELSAPLTFLTKESHYVLQGKPLFPLIYRTEHLRSQRGNSRTGAAATQKEGRRNENRNQEKTTEMRKGKKTCNPNAFSKRRD